MVLSRRVFGSLSGALLLVGVSFVASPGVTASPHEEEEESFGSGTVQVHKVDDADAPLEGVTFVLWTDAEGEPGEPVEPEQTCTTDAEGNCEIEDVEPGTYWVVEDEPPSGHDGAEPQQVEIEGSECIPFWLFLSTGEAPSDQLSASDAPFCFPPCFPFCFIFDGLEGEEAQAAQTAVAAEMVAAAEAAEVQASDSPFPPCFPFCPPDPEVVSLTFVNARQSASLSVAKTVNDQATTAGAPLLIESGDTLDYQVTVSNTGQLPLTITALTDTLQADLPASCTQGVGSTLAAGASFLCVYSSSAAADATGSASASAVDQFGRTVASSSQSSVDVISPGVSLSVSASPASVPAGGGQVTYSYVVTNTGDTPLTDVVVTHDEAGVASALQVSGGVSAASFTGGPSAGGGAGTLAPGATTTYTKTSQVPGGTATTSYGRVTATHPLGTTVGATATVTVTSEAAGAEVLGVSLSKPAAPAAPAAPVAPAAVVQGPALAATGWTTAWLVRLGVLLILIGAVLTLSAGRRRKHAE